MNKRLNTIGIICIITSILIIMANLIYGDVNIAIVGFAVAAVGYILISIGKIKEADKHRKEEYILKYEIDELIYSYRQLGKYIKDKNIPELEDIQTRIEYELSDIAIKVKHREEWINKLKGI